MVMDEAFDEWTGAKNKWVQGRNVGTPSLHGYSEFFEQWADADLREMVMRDRNHPSIVLWSIGNEIDYPNDPVQPPGRWQHLRSATAVGGNPRQDRAAPDQGGA